MNYLDVSRDKTKIETICSTCSRQTSFCCVISLSPTTISLWENMRGEIKKIISCIPGKRVASRLGADVININIPIREGPARPD